MGKAGWGFAKGTAGLVVKGAELHVKLTSGNPNQMLEAASEAYSMGKGAVGHVAESATLLAHGVRNPEEVLNAMAEIGIEKSGEALGGATFETALLVAPAAKGAPVAAVAQEGRRATVTAAIQESRAARAASRFGEYADSPVVQAAERGASRRAAVEAVVHESRAVRAAARESGGLSRYLQAEELVNTRFSSVSDLANEAFLRYQRYVDDAYGAALRAEARGRLAISQGMTREVAIGQKVDSAARIRLRRWLGNEGINEKAGALAEVNRWLRDPAGSGARRVPDFRIAPARTILEGTIANKSSSTPQIRDFSLFSGGDRITIVRPTPLGGSYSIWQ